MSKTSYVGVNIQFPISQEILSGSKTIETRTYPLPTAYIGQTMVIVETPGPKGKFKARIVAKVRFSGCFKYPSKAAFYRDTPKHLVTPNSPWAWREKAKWGWVIELVEPLPHTLPAGRIGIKYTRGLKVP